MAERGRGIELGRRGRGLDFSVDVAMLYVSLCAAGFALSGDGVFLACEDFNRMSDHSFPAFAFFLQWRLARAH